ncbi:MAG TPA: MFS transporter [Thermoleophilaceae bacterium]|nr:MFS transporter [Thermoleophilaceae bacterium]
MPPRKRSRPGVEQRERTVLLTAALGTMLMPLNSTMIAVALPDVVEDLDVSLGSTAWLVSGYLIAQASLQPLAGKLGDRLGRRPLILAGLASFGLASLGAAFAPSLTVLIAFRVLQAVTGALVFPNSIALVRELLPEERRGTVFGLIGSAIGLAAAGGPPLGGALVALGGWRALFLVNLPWVAVAMWLALRSVPRRLATTDRGRFDLGGAVALSLLLGSTAWLLNPGDVPGWAVPAAVVALVVLVVAFVRYELGQDDPIVEPRFLRVRPFAAATASVGLSNLALYGTLLAVPLLLADRPRWSAGEIGLAVGALSFPLLALSPVGGRLSDRAGRRTAAVAGLTLVTVGLTPLALAGEEIAAGLLIGSIAVAGAGLGLSNAAVQAAGVEALAPRHAGVASGIFSTGRYLGGIAAASLVAGLVNGGDGDYGMLFTIEVAAALASTLLALALPGRATTPAVDEAAAVEVT